MCDFGSDSKLSTIPSSWRSSISFLAVLPTIKQIGPHYAPHILCDDTIFGEVNVWLLFGATNPLVMEPFTT